MSLWLRMMEWCAPEAHEPLAQNNGMKALDLGLRTQDHGPQIAGYDAYRLEIEVAPVYIEAKETNMEKGKLRFTLEYWEDGKWMVGRLREAPWVFSQGKDYVELVENIVDAYKMMYRSKKGNLPVRQYKSKSVVFGF